VTDIQENSLHIGIWVGLLLIIGLGPEALKWLWLIVKPIGWTTISAIIVSKIFNIKIELEKNP